MACTINSEKWPTWLTCTPSEKHQFSDSYCGYKSDSKLKLDTCRDTKPFPEFLSVTQLATFPPQLSQQQSLYLPQTPHPRKYPPHHCLILPLCLLLLSLQPTLLDSHHHRGHCSLATILYCHTDTEHSDSAVLESEIQAGTRRRATREPSVWCSC